MRKIGLLFALLLASIGVNAQQIAVVTGSSTTLCQTLEEAIGAASNGSVIYLPGGGFQISDDTKITKSVSIIGVGHKEISGNADGNTVISGNLFFNEGSSNSAVMGCYISGTVYIGHDDTSVNNVVLQYCNLNSVNVYGSKCTGTTVNQNYIRSTSHFGRNGDNQSDGEFTNNVAFDLYDGSGVTIANNIFAKGNGAIVHFFVGSVITNNIMINGSANYVHQGGNNTISNNLTQYTSGYGDDDQNVDGAAWTDVFDNYVGITPASNFHFKEAYKEYEGKVGIYAGDSFSETGLPPVPFIVAKSIPQQTDASGKLNIKIRVKASE